MQSEPLTQCAACGATFECGAVGGKTGCWCAELPPLPKERVTNGGCLCRECLLKKLAAI
ncbi:MAG TPA: cysteine-rich CWC family protein [Verrucomicrobiae bacterium]|nr:cysteine-rich CWC family protein [Verrucomicrobiae bacterium]